MVGITGSWPETLWEMSRAAMTGFLDAANEVRGQGQFSFLDRCVTTPELNKLMGI